MPKVLNDKEIEEIKEAQPDHKGYKDDCDVCCLLATLDAEREKVLGLETELAGKINPAKAEVVYLQAQLTKLREAVGAMPLKSVALYFQGKGKKSFGERFLALAKAYEETGG